MNRNVVKEKAVEFSLQLIKYCEVLDKSRKFIVSKQLLRSGTSIGANIFEAQHAESTADFIHKMKIAMKEANETLYWLWLCKNADGYPESNELIAKTEELLKLISKIIITTKRNNQ